MGERVTVTLTEVELGREIARLLPVMRARREITITTDDTGLAFAIAHRLLMAGYAVTRSVDPFYLPASLPTPQGKAEGV